MPGKHPSRTEAVTAVSIKLGPPSAGTRLPGPMNKNERDDTSGLGSDNPLPGNLDRDGKDAVLSFSRSPCISPVTLAKTGSSEGEEAMRKPLGVVTGASSGIGYNLAKVFAENGFDLVIVSAGERLDKAESDFEAIGADTMAVHADLAKYEGVQELWAAVEGTGRPLDAIAINAGVGVGGNFAETDLDAEINLVRLNVESTVHLAKYAVQKMLRQGSGRILITSSIAGELVAPREAVYAASKAFDLSFAKSLRAELEGSGVSVTALQPGPTDTDFFHRAGLDDTKVGSEARKENDPYEVARQGFDALMKGEKHVYAGNWKLKVEGATAGMTPDALKASMHEKMTRPLGEKKAS